MLHSIMFARDVRQEDAANLESIQSNPDIKLPTKTTLRKLWIQDPVVKHGIDLLVELINKGFRLETDDFKVKSDVSLIDINTDLGAFTDNLTRDALVFGVAFSEYLYDKNKTKIVGFWNMNPVMTDFVRDQDKNIVLTSSGDPKQYIQEVGWSLGTIDTKREIESTPAGQRGYTFNSDKMFHFSFETFSGTIEGISLLQTISDIITDKIEAENGVKEAIKRFGIPIFRVTAGDQKHIVTPDSLKKIKDKLEGIEKKSVIITPDWQKVDILQPKQVAKISENLDYYDYQIAIGLGIPQALLLEKGDTSNKATLRQQIRIFISMIEKKRQRLMELWTNTILPHVSSINNWKTIPKPVWEPITLEDIESMASRFGTYIDKGILTPAEVKNIIIKAEGLSE